MPDGSSSSVAVGTAPGGDPGFLARLGLAIVHPRWALGVASDRRHAGRSGSDLLVLIAIVLGATQLRGLVSSIWLGVAVDSGLGVRALMKVLTSVLTVDLGFLVLGALVLYALAGPKRNLGRAFDLACVAVLPLLYVSLGALVVIRTLDIELVPNAISWMLAGIAYGWAGSLIALAVRSARVAPAAVPAPPREVQRTAKRAGWAILAAALLGAAVQAGWLAKNLERIRPMTTGDAAPAIALPSVGPGGKLGDRVTLESVRGRVTVVDFWATWCNPCLAAMPKLDQLARSHPDVTVLAINLDDPAAARALFDQRGYVMTLLADDGNTSERYGVSSIPHTVVIDRSGVVRLVARGTGIDLAAAVDRIRQ